MISRTAPAVALGHVSTGRLGGTHSEPSVPDEKQIGKLADEILN